MKKLKKFRGNEDSKPKNQKNKKQDKKKMSFYVKERKQHLKKYLDDE